MAFQLLKGLSFLHSKRVVHRDVSGVAVMLCLELSLHAFVGCQALDLLLCDEVRCVSGARSTVWH